MIITSEAHTEVQHTGFYYCSSALLVEQPVRLLPRVLHRVRPNW
jgi:hypothetical protein